VNDHYLIFDLLRIGIAASSLWLGLLILRLCWTRWRTPDPARQDVHPFTYLAFSLALFSIAGFRVASLGQSPTARLWVSFAIVTLAMIGVLKRVSLGSPFGPRR
jgi:hypothetical protein